MGSKVRRQGKDEREKYKARTVSEIVNVNIVLKIDDSRYVVVAGRVEPMVVPRAVEG